MSAQLVSPPFPTVVSAAIDLADAPFGARDRTLRREADFLHGLAFDIGVKPAMDHRERNPGGQRPGEDRQKLVQLAGNHENLFGCRDKFAQQR